MRSGPGALPPSQTTHTPDDEFEEEDTLLPPPAPGLVLPSAEHVFDPPTWPGLGAPLRTGPNAARRAQSAGTPMSRRSPTPTPTPGAALDEPSVAEHVFDPDPTPRFGTTLPTAGAEADTADALPPLPATPRSGGAVELLGYLGRALHSRYQRRRLVQRIERSLRSEAEILDRLLADLGQYAYIEKVDLLSLYPAQAEAGQGAPSAGTPGADARRAESWAARIDAEQLRNQAVLAREEARLTSELMQCMEVRKRDASWATEPALRDEFDLLIGRLAAVRLEAWVQGRARSHCQRHHAQLLATLESMLARPGATGIRPLPNLLLLGSLLVSQRALVGARAVEPWFAVSTAPGRPSTELSPTLFQALWRFQDRLLPRAMLSARAGIERFGYDGEALRRAALLIAVVTGTVLICASILTWAFAAG